MHMQPATRAPPAPPHLPRSFLEKIALHIAKNFLLEFGALDSATRVPLILGIWGGKGQGKTFQTELCFKKLGCGCWAVRVGALAVLLPLCGAACLWCGGERLWRLAWASCVWASLLLGWGCRHGAPGSRARAAQLRSKGLARGQGRRNRAAQGSADNMYAWPAGSLPAQPAHTHTALTPCTHPAHTPALCTAARSVEPIIMSAGELENEWAGVPGKLIRERYR